MAAIRVTVVSPERALFEGGADKVVVQGAKGQIAVFPHHAPLIAKLDAGIVRIHRAAEEGGQVERLAVSGGFMQVRAEHVTLLVNDATRPEDLNLAALEQDLAAVIADLGHPRSDDEFATLLQRRRSLQAQIAIATK